MHDETCLEMARVLGARGEGFMELTLVGNDPKEDAKHYEQIAEVSGRPIMFETVTSQDRFPHRHRNQIKWLESCRQRGLQVYGQGVTTDAGLSFTFEDWNLFDDSDAWRDATLGTVAERKEKLPLLRDPDVSYYLRQERDGLLLGPYEWRATPHWLDAIPDDFAHQLYPDDLDRLESYVEAAVARVPILGRVGVQRVINGPIPYSPDGNPYIGPAHGLPNFFQCCCFSFGIAQAGGAGKTLSEWIVDGRPEWDFWSFDPRRYTDYATKSYVVAKAIELYQNEYAVAYPLEERPAGRPAKTTPLYDRLKAKGAFFCARGGWERAAYFPRPGDPREPRPSFRRAETGFFDAVGEECRAVRERVGILAAQVCVRATLNDAEQSLGRGCLHASPGDLAFMFFEMLLASLGPA